MKKYLNLLLVLGVIIATAGIVTGKLTGTWSNIAIGLSILGIVILIIWLGLLLKFNQGFWSLRSTESGTNAIISTVAVICILGLINFLVFRYQVRIDFTETKLFTLSSQSQEIIASLPQPLKVYIFDLQPNYIDQNLLKNYQRNSPNFSFEFVDPQVNLSLAQEFKIQKTGEVYLQYGDKKQLVQTLNPNTRLSETQLTNAIAKIQQNKQLVVYILQGHGEASLEEKEGSLSQAVKSLEDQGYFVKPLNLANFPIIPPDANAIVVTTPQRELLEGEVKALEKYLQKGGNLLVMLNAQTKSGLESLLTEWGVSLDNRLLVDSSGTGEVLGLGPATTVIIQYGVHPITKDFANQMSIYPLARAISTTTKQNILAIALLITNEQTWAESDSTSETVEFNPDQDIPGPIDVGVALTRKQLETKPNQEKNTSSEKETAPLDSEKTPPSENKPVSKSTNKEEDSTLPIPPQMQTPDKEKSNQTNFDSTPTEAKMVIIGNSTFATNGWFQKQLNGDVFLNSVQWLANDETSVLSIRPKEAKNRRLNLTPLDSGIISWLALLIVPGLGFITAIITWWKRSR